MGDTPAKKTEAVDPSALGNAIGGTFGGIASALPKPSFPDVHNTFKDPVVSILEAGDKNSKGPFANFLNAWIKWGESGMTKEMKSILGVYEAVVTGVSTLISIYVTVPVAIASIAFMGARGLVNKLIEEGKVRADDREKAIKDLQAKLDKELEQLKSTESFLFNSKFTEKLSPDQAEIIANLIDIKPDN